MRFLGTVAAASDPGLGRLTGLDLAEVDLVVEHQFEFRSFLLRCDQSGVNRLTPGPANAEFLQQKLNDLGDRG